VWRGTFVRREFHPSVPPNFFHYYFCEKLGNVASFWVVLKNRYFFHYYFCEKLGNVASFWVVLKKNRYKCAAKFLLDI